MTNSREQIKHYLTCEYNFLPKPHISKTNCFLKIMKLHYCCISSNNRRAIREINTNKMQMQINF